MGDVINLRRLRKKRRRAADETNAAANRVLHGTPKQLKKVRKWEKQRADCKIRAHKLDPEGQR